METKDLLLKFETMFFSLIGALLLLIGFFMFLHPTPTDMIQKTFYQQEEIKALLFMILGVLLPFPVMIKEKLTQHAHKKE